MKMLRLHTIFAIIAICGMFFSCEDTGDVEVIIPKKDYLFKYTPEFYPMHLGNYWLYTDTLFTRAETTVTNYQITIVGLRSDSIGRWWKFQSSPDTLLANYELMQRNDTIYELQTTWGNRKIPVLRYIKPPRNDTIYFFSLIGGDVGYYKQAYFSSKYHVTYKSSISSAGENEIIYPGIGLVSADYYFGNSFPNSEVQYRKVRLLDQHLIIIVPTKN